jgi:hypothetical protein
MNRMRALTLVAPLSLVLLMLLPSLPALAAGDAAPLRGAELQQAMYDLLVVIEKAGGMDSTASDGFYWNSPDVEMALEAIPNKDQFVEASAEIVKRSQAARIAGRNGEAQGPVAVAESGTASFPPNYPDTSTDLDYLLLHPLGLVSSRSTRCSGSGFAYYKAALAGANISLTAAQLACDASGCDPTGIICISVCGATKIVQAGYLVAKAPVDACDSWDAKLDAAENEAAYRNSASLLADLSAHDARIVAMLSNQGNASDEISAAIAAHDASVKALLAQLDAYMRTHDAKLLKHDAEIKLLLDRMLTGVVTNQMEIIKLLKTPEGRRPGWGKEGY